MQNSNDKPKKDANYDVGMCTNCMKPLKNHDIFCAGCKDVFCSSKCKKEAKKVHGNGRCKDLQDDNKKNNREKRVINGNAEVDVMTFEQKDGKDAVVVLEPGIRDVLFAGSKSGDSIPLLKDPITGELYPTGRAWRVFELVQELITSQWAYLQTFMPKYGDKIALDWEAQVLVFTFMDFADLAKQYLAYVKHQTRYLDPVIAKAADQPTDGKRDRPMFQTFKRGDAELQRLFAQGGPMCQFAHEMGFPTVMIVIGHPYSEYKKLPYEKRTPLLFRSAILSDGGKMAYGIVDFKGFLMDLAGIQKEGDLCAVKDRKTANMCALMMSKMPQVNLELYRVWLLSQLGIPEAKRRFPLDRMTEFMKDQLSQLGKVV
jgi:hypothetical protein